ncbi:MAG TPA: HAMP domain-containing histidine kinase [Gammaproteobacteria bacterium]|nr:HAMP domain-containing histidine kinase [Gammaproteobacteria bacterium]
MRLQDPTRDSSTRNLKRLFMLRSLVIGGELLALLLANTLAGLELPVQPLLLIIGILTAVNFWTWRRILGSTSIRDGEFFIQLSIDVLALTGVLYFTGGATNPFAWFFLIPLIIAATVLSATATWSMALLTTACYTLLMFYFIPLAGNDHMQHDANFAQHVFGMWFGFVLSAALIAWFVVGMANTLRKRDRLLAEVREHALRDEQLVAMGTLATGAAHELGTPLATMAILTKELERADVSADMQRKLGILHNQIRRCKQALSVISASAGEVPAESGGLVQVEHFIEKLTTEWQQLHPDTALDVQLQDGASQAHIVAEYTLHQALINLLNNAVEASSETLVLKAGWDSRRLEIEILDRGPGLHPQTASTIDQRKTSHKEYGMGLGLFLTHATLQRLGGNIELFDREGGGTCTRVVLPLATFSLS